MVATYYVGNSLDVVDALANRGEVVDLILTSPPYLNVRNYLAADDPLKEFEVGRERSPAAFIDTLLQHVAAWSRVLAPHGSIVVELGDSYSGSGGAGGDYGPGGMREGQPRFRPPSSLRYVPRDHRPGDRRAYGAGYPQRLSLCLVPELFRVALVYGLNPLTGEPSPAGRWRARNVIRRCSPNPPPGELGKKFRPATSELVIAALAEDRDRYFDMDAVREPSSTGASSTIVGGRYALDRNNLDRGDNGASQFGADPRGVPPLDYWVVTNGGYDAPGWLPHDHYATFPPDLLTRPIRAMVPRLVCTTCGRPSERLTSVEYEPHGDVARQHAERHASADYPQQQRAQNAQGMTHGRATRVTTTTGWSDCGHGTWRRGIVLDPFAGTGTVGMVAEGHGVDSVLIDLDARNLELARERVGGLFLTEGSWQ